MPQLPRRAFATLIAVLVSAGSASAQGAAPGAPAAQPAPVLSADPAVVDFGDVLGGEPALATVKVKNISDAPVPIKQVKTTCGCTVATVHGPDGTEIPARPPQPDMLVTTLEPGQELSVDVKMETANAQGSIEKHLQVYAGDGAVLTLDVPVKARISKAFTVSPDRVDLHNAARTGRIEQTVVVQAQSIGNWTIDGFESAFDGTPLPPWIQLSVLDTEGLSRRVQIVSDGPRPVGPFTARVRIRIGHEKVKNVDFTIYGIIRPDVSFDTGNPTTPDSVSFDQMKKGDVVTRTIKITNSDASIPYLLKSAEIQAPEQLKPLIQSAITTLQEGVSYEVVLTAKAEMAEAFFRGNVLLVAEHPDLARHPISFHGWVKQQQ